MNLKVTDFFHWSDLGGKFHNIHYSSNFRRLRFAVLDYQATKTCTVTENELVSSSNGYFKLPLPPAKHTDCGFLHELSAGSRSGCRTPKLFRFLLCQHADLLRPPSGTLMWAIKGKKCRISEAPQPLRWFLLSRSHQKLMCAYSTVQVSQYYCERREEAVFNQKDSVQDSCQRKRRP